MEQINHNRALPAISERPQLTKRIIEAAQLRSDVVLGSPSARCNGVGICRVMGQGEGAGMPCPHITATLSVLPNGCLRFAFDTAAMNEQYRQLHFNWMLFQIDEPVRLSPRMRQQLSWPSRWIQPGVYRVWETAGALVVDIAGDQTTGINYKA